MESEVHAPPPTDLCQVIERDGILMQMADGELEGPLAGRYLKHVRHCPHCIGLAADLLYFDALVKDSVIADLLAEQTPATAGLPVRSLVPDTRLAADAYAPDGSLLLMQGTLLSANIIAALLSRGIETVYPGAPPPPPSLPVVATPQPIAAAPPTAPLTPLIDHEQPFEYFQVSTPPAPSRPALKTLNVPENPVYQVEAAPAKPLVDEIPAEIPEGFFFGQRGAPRKFHANDYRDLLFVAGAEPAIQQVTKLKAYSQLERSLTTLKEAGAADLGPIRQTSHQIIGELLKDERKTCSLADMFLVSSQLFSHCFNSLVTFVSLVRAMEFDERDVTDAGECVLFHDIGRVLPAEDGISSDDAYHAHPQRGYRFLMTEGGFNERVLSIVLNHHERVDGKGFARGLKGDQLTLLDQALILANTYDTLVTDPVHGVKRSFHRAAQAILQAGGRLVSPEVTHAFLNVFGMYPPGSLVMLKSRELAVVREAVFGRPFQPEVTLLRDAGGQPYAEPIALDLRDAGVPIEHAVDVEQVLEF
ncbi:MAG: HD domain-containing phosphohydrolase [bacterium]